MPLWRFVNKLGKAGKGGGGVPWKCTYCGTNKTTSYTRLRTHLLKDAKSWWVVYGASAPLLQTIALKLLVQPSSSSCAERNWSTYSFVNSLKRNKLAPPRAEDLVYIHSNLRLLSRRTPEYSRGETKMWDIAGDTFGSLDDIGDLEVAQLSLDEPELESVVFNDDLGSGSKTPINTCDTVDVDGDDD